MKATINGLRIAIVALGGYWLLLFIGTHLPPSAISHFRVNDKLVHTCAFAGLAFLIAWAIPTNKSKLHQNTLLAAVIAIIYAGLDELLQIPIGRTADWMDIAADCLGICIGLVIYTMARAAIIKAELNLLQDPAESK